MSNVQTTAERDNVDLTHFIYSTGSIGRLKVLSSVPVIAGDSINIDLVGAIKMSPFRRGLAVDSNVDIFTFYVPHRHTYGQSFVDVMKTGIPKSGAQTLLAVDTPKTPTASLTEYEPTQFLGTHYNQNINQIPKYLYQAYLNIFNNYFKIPYLPDVTTALASLTDEDCRDGINCQQLEAIWSRPLNPNAEQSRKFADMAGNDGIDIIGLNQAYGVLHTQQERDNFNQRYRDIVSSFGGSTHYDADTRPHLVYRTNFWASGFDTQGTDQSSLGMASGRTQQGFHHNVPRFYVPEHGVMMTLALVRFPPTHQTEMHPLVGKAALTYNDIACDPALVGNYPPVDMPFKYIFQGQTVDTNMRVPHSQHYRFHPSHVDFRYRVLKGFPFIGRGASSAENMSTIVSAEYDQCFQTTQLGHWNMQLKCNCHCLRHIPSARDSIMTN